MGLLHQVGDLVDERRLRLEIDCSADRFSKPGGLLDDRRTPGLRVEHDALVAQQRGEFVGRRDRHQRIGVGAVHVGGAAGAQLRDLCGHQVGAPQRDEPTHRTAVGELRVAPAHVLVGAQRADHRLDDAAQHPQHVASGLLHLHCDVLGTVELGTHQVGDVDLLATREALAGLGRVAVRVERGGDLRALAQGLGVGLVRRHRRDGGDDAARGADDGDVAVLQAGGCETVGDTGAHLLDRLADDVRREFLDADLEREGLRLVGAAPRRRRLALARRHDCLADDHLRGLTLQQRVAEFGAAVGPQGAGLAGELAHQREGAGALGGRDGAAAVEHVERVRTLEHVCPGGHGQTSLDELAGLGGVALEQVAIGLHVGGVEVVLRHLELVLAEHLAVADARGVLHVLEVAHALQRHHDALDAVGQLDADRLEVLADDLLEVGELGDLHAVQPHLPAQTPGADGRLLPVVLDEAHVVGVEVDAQGTQRLQVELLRVARVGLEDHLELGVRLQPVGVLAVPAVVRAHGRLDVGHPPRLGTEHPHHRGRVHGSGAHFGVVGLDDHAATVGPELLQGEQGFLNGQHRARLSTSARPTETLHSPANAAPPSGVGGGGGATGRLSRASSPTPGGRRCARSRGRRSPRACGGCRRRSRCAPS